MSPFGKIVTIGIALVTGTAFLTGVTTAYMLRPAASADTMTATYAPTPVRRAPAVVAPRVWQGRLDRRPGGCRGRRRLRRVQDEQRVRHDLRKSRLHGAPDCSRRRGTWTGDPGRTGSRHERDQGLRRAVAFVSIRRPPRGRHASSGAPPTQVFRVLRDGRRRPRDGPNFPLWSASKCKTGQLLPGKLFIGNSIALLRASCIASPAEFFPLDTVALRLQIFRGRRRGARASIPNVMEEQNSPSGSKNWPGRGSGGGSSGGRSDASARISGGHPRAVRGRYLRTPRPCGG